MTTQSLAPGDWVHHEALGFRTVTSTDGLTSYLRGPFTPTVCLSSTDQGIAHHQVRAADCTRVAWRTDQGDWVTNFDVERSTQ
jgi:hypothetical protein